MDNEVKVFFSVTELLNYLESNSIRGIPVYNEQAVVCDNGDVWKKYVNGDWRLYITRSKVPYRCILLDDEKTHKVKSIQIHRLVAETFVENPFPDAWNIVNHIDGDTHNNAAANLEWCDYAYNSWDAVQRHAPKHLTNLRKIRVENGMDASFIARTLGMREINYTDIENLVKKPLPVTAKQLEELFGESIDFLLSPVPGEVDRAKMKIFIQEAVRLPEKQYEQVMRQAERVGVTISQMLLQLVDVGLNCMDAAIKTFRENKPVDSREDTP